MIKLEGVGLRDLGGALVLQDLDFSLPQGSFRWQLRASEADRWVLLACVRPVRLWL